MYEVQVGMDTTVWVGGAGAAGGSGLGASVGITWRF